MDDGTPVETIRLHLLSELLDGAGGGGGAAYAWSENDLRAMLEHLMSTPLHLSLIRGGADFAALLHDHHRPVTYGLSDLFADPAPPAPVLRRVKDVVKALAGGDEPPLPPDMLLLLYYALVALARSRGVNGISNISPVALADGLAWAGRVKWSHPRLRAVIRGLIDSTVRPAEGGGGAATGLAG